MITPCHYFPQSEIVGAEINRNSLRKCSALDMDHRVQFIESTPENIAAQGPYDLIFCMAVLQRTPGTIEQKQIRDLRRIYLFEKFQKKVAELDGLVTKGGLFVIHISQYDLPDAIVADRYFPLERLQPGRIRPLVLRPGQQAQNLHSPPPQHFVKKR